MVYIIIILNSLILRVKNYPQKGDTNSANEDCLLQIILIFNSE